MGANCDHERFREDLARIDQNIRASQVESMAVDFALEDLGPRARPQDRAKRAQFAVVALRMEVLRHVLGQPGFRAFSGQLARSDLLADFCQVRDIEKIKWTSKSTVERASKLFSAEQVREMCGLLTGAAAGAGSCGALGLEGPVDASVCLVDSTCLGANIHYPVDWVLLRDVSRTLLKAVKLIRSEGLVNRMQEGPEELAREMNRLCIEMTHCRRSKGAGKRRKEVLRKMKRLLKRIGEHARKHRDLLAAGWENTRWSLRQAGRITARIEEKLELLPQVVKQAHERIIGGRQVAAADKILSAHEPDIHVLVRGKAGAEVEFGNGLFLAEGPGGYILDYHLYRGAPPADTAKLRASLLRQLAIDTDQPLAAAVGDRGFSSRAIGSLLEGMDIEDMTCPRDPAELAERMAEPAFRDLQKRRGSTEARIAILKNNGGRVCRAKGFQNRSRAVGYGVLAHNLWWIARKVRERKEQERKRAA